jgi:hypothetical protein
MTGGSAPPPYTTRHHGTASTSGASHAVVVPACSSNPARTESPYSYRNERRCAQSASRGVVVAFTLMGSSLPPVSTTRSTSSPVAVRQ